MRTRIWAAGVALGAVMLAGGAVAAPASAAASAPVLVGYYDTIEECFEVGQTQVGEHACVRSGARWALYVYA
ncbi:hypothetical protein ACFUN8_12855 [Streptomyces sp. NPDC057307]|uniref:hypothetical protein n=1 Tax=Streptomyces sp. NPDC057307 TaxID=3346096 RepID=UPI0036255814